METTHPAASNFAVLIEYDPAMQLETSLYRAFAIALLLLAAACTTQYKLGATSFEPVGASGFKYRGPVDAYTPPGPDTDSEKFRISMLQEYLDQNHLCPSGYEITSRIYIEKFKGLFGSLGDVFYEGKCKV